MLEMAIVLIVIGLVAGGVMQGMSLMRQAELKRVVADMTEIGNSVSLFFEKYGYFPGDMPTATSIWGRADSGMPLTDNCANPDTDINATDPLTTCNGNGDGYIANATTLVNNTEAFRLWQHLQNAKLISGSYTGIGSPNGGGGWLTAIPGENVPMAPVRGGGYFIETKAIGDDCGGGGWTGPESAADFNYISLGAARSDGGPWDPIFTPEDAHALDEKLDDGKPGLGNMVAHCAASCADSQDMETANYLTDDENVLCYTAMRIE